MATLLSGCIAGIGLVGPACADAATVGIDDVVQLLVGGQGLPLLTVMEAGASKGSSGSGVCVVRLTNTALAILLMLLLSPLINLRCCQWGPLWLGGVVWLLSSDVDLLGS